jgi:hypothetical protein
VRRFKSQDIEAFQRLHISNIDACVCVVRYKNRTYQNSTFITRGGRTTRERWDDKTD